MWPALCYRCEHWKETNFHVRYGKCSIYNINTEWYAGLVYQSSKKVKLCPHFKQIKDHEWKRRQVETNEFQKLRRELAQKHGAEKATD